jgi:hypothetical protein
MIPDAGVGRRAAEQDTLFGLGALLRGCGERERVHRREPDRRPVREVLVVVFPANLVARLERTFDGERAVIIRARSAGEGSGRKALAGASGS